MTQYKRKLEWLDNIPENCTVTAEKFLQIIPSSAGIGMAGVLIKETDKTLHVCVWVYKW